MFDDVSVVFVVLGNDMTCYTWCCAMTQDWYVIMCNDVCAKQNLVVITFSATHSTAVCNGLKAHTAILFARPLTYLCALIVPICTEPW